MPDEDILTLIEALDMLPDRDDRLVHTFVQSGNMLIGADWDRDELLDLMKSARIELSGPTARATGHGMVILRESGPLFIETKEFEDNE